MGPIPFRLGCRHGAIRRQKLQSLAAFAAPLELPRYTLRNLKLAEGFAMKSMVPAVLCSVLAAVMLPGSSSAQMTFPAGTLDPTANIVKPRLVDTGRVPLPEQYIWDAGASTSGNNGATRLAPRFFRAAFRVETVPPHATLYIAGPDAAEVYVNGKLAEKVQNNPASPLDMPVFQTDVSSFLRGGENTLAIEVTPRGGEKYLVAKIVPRAAGEFAAALLISGPAWKATQNAATGWQNADFDNSSWPAVHAFGSIESSLEFYQGNDDGGLYRWPGYSGVSAFLAHVSLAAQSVQQVFRGRSTYSNLDALIRPGSPDATKEFTVHLASTNVPEQEAPSILLDFGREINGRIKFVSDSVQPIHVTVQYGESRGEALNQPYLGVDPLTIHAHATAYGPKSAFRYAKIRFVGGGQNLRFRSIQVDDIYYPVQYRGSFESSDPELNRIWQVGVYTAHLCMQDDIWDAPKRDRERWAGDLDVSGRVINDVFGDQFLMQSTMTHLLGSDPGNRHVNDIAGYSAWWISELTQYYLHTGSKEYLQGLHQKLLQLLHHMDNEVDNRNLFVDKSRTWDFVDWSPELDGDTPEARRATQFEYYLAYRDGAFLLHQLGDNANAENFEQRAQLLKDASQKYLLDASTGTFGTRWQTNAIAVFSGVADPAQYGPIWNRVLSSAANTKYTALVMTPYYNYYVISAMAETGHRTEALDWIRKYWGGMIAEGATSFWEAYYPSWPKRDFHASLQADDGTGYFVSLAHGWSAGPSVWLMEQILGIQPKLPGFAKVTIRPDLAGLAWAKGAEPTPHGLLKVSVRQRQNLETTIDLPQGVEANVLVPVSQVGQQVLVNGAAVESAKPAENGPRAAVVLRKPGRYVLTAK
jgi:alpha-L-rhamnosidase